MLTAFAIETLKNVLQRAKNIFQTKIKFLISDQRNL